MKVKYIFDGLEYDNKVIDNFDFLKEILFRNFKEWNDGTGDSAINLINKKISIIFFKITEGIYLECLPNSTSPNINPNQETKTLTHYVGGEPMKIPSNCLCNEETAFKIIKYFIENDGELHPDYNWIDIYELIPDEFE